MRSFAVGLLLVVACSSSGSEKTQENASALGASTSAAVAPGRRIVTLQLGDFGTGMRALRQRGYDIAGVDVHHARVDVIIDTPVLEDLTSDGIVPFREVSAPIAPLAASKGPDPAYQTPASLETLLTAQVAAHPTIAAMSSIGKSLEGRDIWAVKITSNVTQHDPTKPVIFFNGMHHAREVMSTEVPLDTVEYLLSNYGNDTKVTHWVDSNEIWVVPMLNVDGNNRVWTNDAMWRKNARGCNEQTSCASGTGVDINRNYPYEWAACNGSSTDTSADDYHGPSAASEPETNVLMDFVQQMRPVFDISYHSYSELVLYPYGCQGQNAPTANVLESIGKGMAALLPSDNGSGTYTYGTPWAILYAVDGDDMDWMYNQYNVAPFAIEINGTEQGFQPSYAKWRNATTTKLRPAWELLLDRLDQSAIRGVVTVAGAVPSSATLQIASAGATTGTETRTLNPDGSFHVVVLPGQYTLTLTVPNQAPYVKTVTVADTRIDLTISL